MNELLSKVWHRAVRELHFPYKWYLRDCERGPSVCAYGRVNIKNDGRVRLDRKVTFMNGMVPIAVTCGRGAELSIGAYSAINYGVSIRALKSIRIGQRCLIATFVQIADAVDDEGEPSPIVIGDHVWIAHGAVISPGVRIGDGAVVAAGSVVERDVPPGCLAIGRPARAVPIDLVAN